MNRIARSFPGSRSSGFVLTLLLILGGAASARAADKVSIRPQLHSGLSFGFVMALETQMDISSPQGQRQHVVASANLEGTLTYKKVENGVPISAEVSVSDKSSLVRTVNGQRENLPFPLAGKKINLSRGENGQLIHDAGDALDPSTAEGLKKLLNVDTTVYPANEVAVGDEWSPDPTKLPPELTMNGQGKVDLKCKLLKLGESHGRPTFDVSIGGTITGAPQRGVDMQLTLGGVTQIDRATGIPVEAGTVMKGTIRGPQQTVEMQMKMSATYTIAGEAAPAPPVAVIPGANPLDPAPANPPAKSGGNPLDPPTAPANPPAAPAANPLDPPPANGGERPRNPLAADPPAAPASPFQGIFKNEKVTANFNVGGTTVGGAITIGTRTFPVSAAIENGKVVGDFTASGAKFNFTASLNGDTMEFNSEGNKYTLKREAAARPQNPLAQ